MKKLLVAVLIALLPAGAMAQVSNYPGSLDTVTLPACEGPTPCFDLADTNVLYDTHWDTVCDAVIELETKLGITADTCIDKDILVGDGAGSSKWVQMSGDATILNTGEVAVVDDLHAHTGTSLSGIAIADTSIVGGTNGIDIATDTINFDPTEVDGNITWGASAGATIAWTWDVTTGDPSLTFGNGLILIPTTQQLQFRDTAIYLASLNDGYLDIEADTAIRMLGPVDMGANALDCDSNTVTLSTVAGAIDAGGATSLEIPNGTPTIDTDGEIGMQTATNVLQFQLNGTTYELDMTGYATDLVLKATTNGTFTLQGDSTGGSPLLHTVGNPNGDWNVTFDDDENVVWTTNNDSNDTFFKITNSDGGLSGGNQYLLELQYSNAANDGNVSADFINCTDSDSSVFSVTNAGTVTSDATITADWFNAEGSGAAGGSIKLKEGSGGGSTQILTLAAPTLTDSVTLYVPNLQTANTNNIIVSDNTLVTSVDGAALEINAGVLDVNDVTAAMLVSGDFGDFTCNGTDCSTDSGSIGVADLASVDFGEFTCNGSACTVDASTILAADMGNSDHGDVSWTTNVATVENVQCTTCIGVGEMAASDFGDFTCAGGTSCTVDNGTIAAADLASADFGDFTVTAGTAALDASTVDATELAATLTFADGDYIDMSAIDCTDGTPTAEGLRLPQATECAAATTEGQICWDSDSNTLYIGNDGGVTAIGSGGSPLWNNIQDPDAGQTIVFEGSSELTTFQTNLDAAATFFTISDIDSDLTVGETVLASFDFYDAQGDDEMTYLQMRADTDGTPVIEFLFNDDGFKVGNGGPSTAMDGEDVYIEGTLEVDGACNFDGAVDIAGALTGPTSITTGLSSTPSITLSDQDNATGEGTITFASATANDIVGTIKVDESGTAVTYMTFDATTDSVTVGPSASVDNNNQSFIIRGDADSTAVDNTDEALTIALTPAATPTAATWDITSTQSAGYKFDKDVTITGNDLTFGNAESIDNNTNGTIDINATTMTIGSATDYLTITNDGAGVVISDTDGDTNDITIGDNTDTVTISAGNWDVDASGNLSGIASLAVTATEHPYLGLPAAGADEDWYVGVYSDNQDDDGGDPLEFRTNATQNTEVAASLDAAGTLSVLAGIDGIGAVDIDYGSADITDHSFTTNDCTVVLDGGITVSTGDTITLGTTAWDVTGASDAIDGEVIGDDTIDDDSIDFADVTCADLTTSDCGATTFTAAVTVADSQTLTFDESAADPNDADVRLSATDGKITIASVNGSQTDQQSISIDLDVTDDEIDVTATNATKIDFNALNLVTTGTIQAGMVVNSDANGMTGAEMTTAGVRGTLFIATGAGTWILPDAAGGESLCLVDSGTAHDLIVDCENSNVITLKGTALTANLGITNAAGSTTGDFVCFVATAADNWMTLGMGGTWASQ